jgi:hypothetical protein
MAGEEIDATYAVQQKILGQYLRSMGADPNTDTLLDLMIRTPPEELTPLNSERFPGLFGFIPSRDQWLRNHCGPDYLLERTCMLRTILRDRLTRRDGP